MVNLTQLDGQKDLDLPAKTLRQTSRSNDAARIVEWEWLLIGCSVQDSA